MVKVVLIGSGNLAQHLIVALQEAVQFGNEIQLIQTYARKPENLIHLLNVDTITSNINELKEADLYIIAVSDNAISEIASRFLFSNRLVVHTSGAMSMDALGSHNRKGVFYPLQTFTKGKKVNFQTIPICLEAENASDYKIIEKVAQAISTKVSNIDSQQRKALHLAAVFVNNFTNHLYQIGKEICEENQIPFEILQSLILETAQKITSISPEKAQTGPAIRNDSQTIAAHEQLLTNQQQLKLYKILTQSIQDNVKKL